MNRPVPFNLYVIIFSLLIQVAIGQPSGATKQQLPVEIVAPIAGDIVWQGQFIVVQWKGSTGEEKVSLRLRKGTRFVGPKKNCPDNGTCQLRIPPVARTGEYQVVMTTDGGEVASRSFFVKAAPSSAVQAAAVQLLPNRELSGSAGGQQIDRGQRLSLRWDSGDSDLNVVIRLMSDTAMVKMKTAVPNDGKQAFQIPRFAPLGTYYFKLTGPQGELLSRPFTVKRPAWWLSALFNKF